MKKENIPYFKITEDDMPYLIKLLSHRPDFTEQDGYGKFNVGWRVEHDGQEKYLIATPKLNQEIKEYLEWTSAKKLDLTITRGKWKNYTAWSVK